MAATALRGPPSADQNERQVIASQERARSKFKGAVKKVKTLLKAQVALKALGAPMGMSMLAKGLGPQLLDKAELQSSTPAANAATLMLGSLKRG